MPMDVHCETATGDRQTEDHSEASGVQYDQTEKGEHQSAENALAQYVITDQHYPFHCHSFPDLVCTFEINSGFNYRRDSVDSGSNRRME